VSRPETFEPELVERIGVKETRKLNARRRRQQSIWFGLGMFGMIGWSVAVPSLIGVAVGLWIDQKWPSRYSWTLMLLITGVVLGCLNAWNWIDKESRRD
jgi:ATP synthase protein I